MKTFLTLTSLFISTICFSQIKVIQFNANWNKANSVTWLNKLTDCKTSEICIVANKEAQAKYKIVVVPTIIVFDHGEEVKRYQADLSFKITATSSEIQEEIDNLIMSDF